MWDRLILAEVTDGGVLELVPVDHAIDLDRRNAPALPGIRIGLVQVGKGIAIIILLVRVEVFPAQLLFGRGNIDFVNKGDRLELYCANLGHVGNEAA